jgi:hypothetical protein
LFQDAAPKGEILLVNATLYAHVEKKGEEMNTYFNVRVGNRFAFFSTERVEYKSYHF